MRTSEKLLASLAFLVMLSLVGNTLTRVAHTEKSMAEAMTRIDLQQTELATLYSFQRTNTTATDEDPPMKSRVQKQRFRMPDTTVE